MKVKTLFVELKSNVLIRHVRFN